MKWNTQDDGYFDIATGIREVVKELKAANPSPPGRRYDKANPFILSCRGWRVSSTASLSIVHDPTLMHQIGRPCLRLKLSVPAGVPLRSAGRNFESRDAVHESVSGRVRNRLRLQTSARETSTRTTDLGWGFIPGSLPNVPGGFAIERDQARTFLLPGSGFPTSLHRSFIWMMSLSS